MSADPELTPQALEAWGFVRQMLDDMTAMVVEDAETELELLEGLRVLGRVTALCSELSLDVDVESPWFFPMYSEARLIGGPNPDGEYQLAMISGAHRYRVSGRAGHVRLPRAPGARRRRPHAATHGRLRIRHRPAPVADDGTFALVLSATEPSPGELGERALGRSTRRRVGHRRARVHRRPRHRGAVPADASSRSTPSVLPRCPTTTRLAQQLTAMGWTIAKLATLHRTIKPELLDQPNELLTADAADLGAADTTPDNLYMIGTFRLADDEALVIDIEPPATRYWSVTLENIWHECIDHRRRRSSLTNAHAVAEATAPCASSSPPAIPDHPNWLDTGHRHRGFVLLRWLDNPERPHGYHSRGAAARCQLRPRTGW